MDSAKKSLRVAFLSYGYGKDHLGTGRSAWHLVTELRNLGVDVDVFTTNFRTKGFGAPLFYLKNTFLNLKKYDIVHSNEGAGILVSHPHLVETYHHDYKTTYDLNSLIFNMLENYQCKRAHRIIVPSFKTMRALLNYGFTGRKISIIPHGVDSTVFKPNVAERDRLRSKYGVSKSFVVLNVGQLIGRKRQVDIVKSCSGLSGLSLVIVGKGPELQNIEKAAKEEGVRLIHFESISDDQLVELYNMADVYISTSILEGFQLTLLEAMSCGLPIIAYKVADFERLIGDCGFLLQIGDKNGVKRAIQVLKDNIDLRNRMGKAALLRSKKYDWKSAAQEHLKVYLKL